ncbi:heterochromatin protein 1-like [Aphis craccivora]|uniref:Heterochromatin protein 1-like n=1 Tax=Aphis craccivora TaxID=307492 RepID=A0A6G0ZDW6_APHCR|nr:heterochromatin protein 1-like [Aphis craccivora]
MPKNKQNKPEEYEVEKIIFHQSIGNSIVYFIKWKNFSMLECTWEPKKNLKKCKKVLKIYRKELKKKKQKKKAS